MAFLNHCSECAKVSKFKHKNRQLKIHLRTGVIDIIIASLTAGITSSAKLLQMWCFLPKKYWETEHGLNSLSIKKCGLVGPQQPLGLAHHIQGQRAVLGGTALYTKLIYSHT